MANTFLAIVSSCTRCCVIVSELSSRVCVSVNYRLFSCIIIGYGSTDLFHAKHAYLVVLQFSFFKFYCFKVLCL